MRLCVFSEGFSQRKDLSIWMYHANSLMSEQQLLFWECFGLALLFIWINGVIASLLEKNEVVGNCRGREMVKNVFELSRGE